MNSFDEIWQLLNPQAQYANRKRACYEMWQSFSPEQRERIIAIIKDKLAKGKFVDYNPYFAIKKNSQQQTLTLSFDEYYDRFHTTLERDGWHMANPTGNKVIYVFSTKGQRRLPGPQ